MLLAKYNVIKLQCNALVRYVRPDSKRQDFTSGLRIIRHIHAESLYLVAQDNHEVITRDNNERKVFIYEYTQNVKLIG